MKRIIFICLIVFNFLLYTGCKDPADINSPQGSSPVITLQGEDSLYFDLGEEYEEPGYTAADAEDGDLTSSVTVEYSIDTSYPNTSTVKYLVKDSDGNAATARRSVHAEYQGLDVSVDVDWRRSDFPLDARMAISDDGNVFAVSDGITSGIKIFYADGTQASIPSGSTPLLSGDGRTIVANGIVWQEEAGVWEDVHHFTSTKQINVNDDGTRIVGCDFYYLDTDASIVVHDCINGVWTESEYLFSELGITKHITYSSLSGDGNTLILSEYQTPYNYDAPMVIPKFGGSMYVFRDTGSGWTQEFYYSSAYDYEHFGWVTDVSYDGSVLVVGAIQNFLYNGGGSVYFFHEHTAGWTSFHTGLNNGQTDSQYGFSVSLSDDGSLSLVGAPFYDDIDYGADTGFYHLHKISEDGIEATGGDMPLEVRDNIQFGNTVLLSGDGNTVVNYIAGKNRIDIGYSSHEYCY